MVVKLENLLPLSIQRKCRTAKQMANNSLPKVTYLDSGGINFLKKNDIN